MNELQWQVSTPEGTFDHGALLGQGLQAPVLYLRYNSGRHISDNGADLAVLLDYRTESRFEADRRLRWGPTGRGP